MSIILTTTKPLDLNNFSFRPVNILVTQLKTIHTVELFLENSDDISDKEILDLILEDDKYPIRQFLDTVRPNNQSIQQFSSGIPEKGSLKEYITDEIEKRILGTFRNERHKINALQNHDLFKQLCGNPLSVSIFASYHKSKKLLSSENALITFYKIMKEELNVLNRGEEERET